MIKINYFEKLMETLAQYNTSLEPLSEDQVEEMAKLAAMSIVLDEKDSATIEGVLRDNLPESNIDTVIQKVDQRLIPYNDCAFLRKSSIDEQKKILSFFYDNYIIISNDPDEDKIPGALTKEEQLICQKLLNTLLKFIVAGNHSDNAAIKFSCEFFGLTSEVSKHIVSLYCHDRKELRYVALMKQLFRLNERLTPVLSTLRDIFSDESDNESDEE